MAPRIDMLGTGNAFLPHGRHHSFAMVDQQHIIDAPPTALAGLRRHGMNIADLRTVFITHVHGDHVFGFPFLLLERKYISDRDGVQPLTVVGTPFVKERLTQLCQLAFPGSLDSMIEHVTWVMEDVGELDDGGDGNALRCITTTPLSPTATGSSTRAEHRSSTAATRGRATRSTTRLNARTSPSWRWVFPIGFPRPIITNQWMSALSERCKTPLGITHTYIDEPSSFATVLESEFPEFADHVIHLSDRMSIEWSGERWVVNS